MQPLPLRLTPSTGRLFPLSRNKTKTKTKTNTNTDTTLSAPSRLLYTTKNPLPCTHYAPTRPSQVLSSLLPSFFSPSLPLPLVLVATANKPVNYTL